MHRYQAEASQLIKLAAPVLLASIAQTGMGFVDTVMAGGVSATDMASVAIASSIWFPVILFGMGLLMALIPIVAQLNGSGRSDNIAFEIQQGFSLALFLTIPVSAVLFQTEIILSLMNVDALMAEKTIGYMHAIMWSIPAFLLFQTLRSFTDGMALTKPAMVVSFIGLAANVPLNWMFVYGKLGAPALGGVGCGVATAIVYWLMCLSLFLYVITSKRLKHIKLFSSFHKPLFSAQIRLIKLGLPVAMALFFEVTLFAVVALLIAPLGSVTVAAHQVAINFSTLVFMLPLSIGSAASIRVGHKLGEEQVDGAQIASQVAIMIAVTTAIATGILTIVLREPITLLYTNNPEVVSLATQLLMIAAVYQVTDAIQVTAAGVLRGYKDMKSIFICTFVAYWLLGFPTGYLLGLTDVIVDAVGVHGFWIGFIVGLSSAALFLSIRLKWMHKQDDSVQLTFASR